MAENLEFEEIEKQSPEGNQDKYETHNQKDSKNEKGKKAPSAYILFMKDLRNNQEFITSVDKSKFLSEASKLWNELDADVKQKYNEKAQELKEQYAAGVKQGN